MSPKNRRILGIIVGAASLVLLVYFLATSGVRLSDVGPALVSVGPGALLLALLVSLAELVVRTVRFWFILAHFDVRIPMRRLISVQLIGVFAGNVSPMRLGEPLKGVVLRSKFGAPLAVGVVGTVIERVLDLVVIAILLLIAAIALLRGGAPTSLAVALLLALAFVAAYVLIIASISGGRVARWLSRFASERRWLQRIARSLETLSLPGRSYARSSIPWALLSILILVLDVSIVYVLCLGYGLNLSFLSIASVIAVAALGGIASQAPGGIAATEAILVSLVTGLGVSPLVAFSIVLLSRLLSFYLFTIVGWALVVRSSVALATAAPKDTEAPDASNQQSARSSLEPPPGRP